MVDLVLVQVPDAAQNLVAQLQDLVFWRIRFDEILQVFLCGNVFQDEVVLLVLVGMVDDLADKLRVGVHGSALAQGLTVHLRVRLVLGYVVLGNISLRLLEELLDDHLLMRLDTSSLVNLGLVPPFRLAFSINFVATLLALDDRLVHREQNAEDWLYPPTAGIGRFERREPESRLKLIPVFCFSGSGGGGEWRLRLSDN